MLAGLAGLLRCPRSFGAELGIGSEELGCRSRLHLRQGTRGKRLLLRFRSPLCGRNRLLRPRSEVNLSLSLALAMCGCGRLGRGRSLFGFAPLLVDLRYLFQKLLVAIKEALGLRKLLPQFFLGHGFCALGHHLRTLRLFSAPFSSSAAIPKVLLLLGLPGNDELCEIGALLEEELLLTARVSILLCLILLFCQDLHRDSRIVGLPLHPLQLALQGSVSLRGRLLCELHRLAPGLFLLLLDLLHAHLGLFCRRLSLGSDFLQFLLQFLHGLHSARVEALGAGAGA
mmetsp:Transcript_108995/g.232935  ORF Transcript_108995/g.232935 Transcript_108995/m.232935 type:complete len:285 (-) Transcript_108995:1060-1914(-)